MSLCMKCGTQLENENQQFCTNCGAKVEVQGETSETVVNGDSVCEQVSTEQVVNYPMKWFKFLIYFSLFCGALINFVSGIGELTGIIYFTQSGGEVTANMIYDVYGSGLKAVDVIYGIILIVFAGFMIYTRFRLAKYKANGPICLYITYGASVVLNLIYSIALLAVTGINQIFASANISAIISSVVMIFVNYVYFKKRKELFIN